MTVQLWADIRVTQATSPPPVLIGVVKHDYEVYGVSRPEYNNAPAYIEGLPETVKLLNSTAMPLTEPWQLALFWMMKQVALASGMPDNAATLAWLKDAFHSLLRDNAAFSNNFGSDTRADFINGTNLDQGPILVETIVTGGTLLRVLDGGVAYNIRGEYGLAVGTLDGDQGPPPLLDFNPWLQKPSEYFFATTSRRDVLPDGTRQVIQLGPMGDFNTPFFVMGRGRRNYIAVNRVRILQPGEAMPSPYNPPA